MADVFLCSPHVCGCGQILTVGATSQKQCGSPAAPQAASMCQWYSTATTGTVMVGTWSPTAATYSYINPSDPTAGIQVRLSLSRWSCGCVCVVQLTWPGGAFPDDL